MRPSSTPPRTRRRGNYTSMLLVALPGLIGAGAVVVDLSAQKVVRTQLQAVADISAMAGTDLLDGTEEGLLAAQARASRAAMRNRVNGRAVVLSPGDMITGAWDAQTGTLDADADVELIDSFEVSTRIDDVPTTFAEIAFDQDRMGVKGASTGFNPPDDAASAVGCYLPIAIPSCLFEVYTVAQLNAVTLTVNPAGRDNMGWGRVGGHPSASWTRDQLWDCEQDGVIALDDEVGLQNGVVTSALKEVADVISASPTTWNTQDWGPQPPAMSGSAISPSKYGRTLEGAIIIFDGGPEYCEAHGGAFNGTERLVGFAWAVVYDVRTSGSASSKNMKMKIDTYVSQTVGLRGGGGFFAGVTYDAPGVLVR